MTCRLEDNPNILQEISLLILTAHLEAVEELSPIHKQDIER